MQGGYLQKKTHLIFIEKAQLVVQRFAQHSNDYSDTYALVAKIVSIQLILTYTAKINLKLYTFNIKAAFLNAPLTQEVYVQQISGFPLSDPKKVL